MKKIISAIIGIFMLSMTFMSCSDTFLYEKPLSSYAPVTLTDSLGFQASLVGLYTQLSYWETWTDHQGWLCVWQSGTDIAYSTPNQEGIEIPYYNYNLLISTDAAAAKAWSLEYQMINNANNIITSVESSSVTGITQNGKNIIDAEARFFRAYAYNILSTLFGGVPLITKPVNGPQTNFARASVDSVNSLIVKDLQYAVTYLPDAAHIVNQERVNKAAAQQLLATVDLRVGNYTDAINQCNNIIGSHLFNLVTARYGVNSNKPGDAFHDMFIVGNQRRSQGNTEAIWVLQQENPSSVVGGSTGYPQHRRVWGAAYYNIKGIAICDSLGGRSLARMRLNNWVLYGLYPQGDMRNSKYNIHRKYWYNDPSYPALLGQPVPYAGADTLYKICPQTMKWGQFDPNDVFGYGMWKDFIMMRLGETYLLLAEAQCLKNDFDGAATSINVLRSRAQAPLVTASQININFILDERARELLAEENRRMTLLRVGQELGVNMLAKRALRLNQEINCPHPVVGLDSTSMNKMLLPIPQSEIDLNKDAILTQNPGY